MKPKHIFLLLLLAVIWGVNFIPIRVGLNHMPPLTFLAWRLLLTAFPAILFVKKPDVPTKKIVAHGLALFFGQFGLVYTAVHLGMAIGLVALIVQTQEFSSIGMAAILLREKPTVYQISGAVVAFLGIIIVAMHTGGGEVTMIGLLLALLAAFCWATGNMIIKNMGKVDMLGVIIWANLYAFFPVTALAWILEGKDAILQSAVDMQWASVLSILYIIILSTYIGYIIWGRSLMKYPTAMVTPFTLMVPVVAMACAAVFLGEGFPLWKMAATCLILFGLGINQFGGRLRERFFRTQ